MITVKNLSKFYGTVPAVSDISFDIKKGEIVGFLGPNGAGKTTTMKILTCYMPPTSGSVFIGDLSLFEFSKEIRSRIGYLPENTPLYDDMNVFEYLEFLSEMHQIPSKKKRGRIREVLELCGLKEKMKSDISTLSKGYRQRVGLAQALIHDPEILILDEPTSGLDPNQIIEIRNLIKEAAKKKTILLSTHILSEVEAVCHRVLIIHKGKIVGEGTVDELRAQISNRSIIRVDVEGGKGEILAQIKLLDDVLRVQAMESPQQGVWRFMIETPKDIDLRKRLNHHLLDHGFELVGMQKETISMEDVFTQLTK